MTDTPTAEFRVFRIDPAESTELRVQPVGSGDWSSVVDMVAAASDARALALVRPGTILHHGFRDEAIHALTDPGLENVPWLGLASDGIDLEGNGWDTGNYLDDPADPAPRPLRIAAHADPAILILAPSELSRSGLDPVPSSHDEFIARLLAADRPTMLTSRLRFSAPDRLTPRDAASNGTASLRARDVGWLRTVRNDPTIAVVIRTDCDRPALFRRAVAAADAELGRDGRGGHELIVVSTRQTADIDTHIADHAPGTTSPIRTVSAADSDLPGRTAAMLAGIEAARSDYVWYVDDDDWIEPGALEAVTTTVHAGDRPLIVGAVSSFEERADGSLERIRTYVPEEWHRAFTGWNHLPNCALVFPTVTCRERVRIAGIRHDLGEDYALQLLALTTPGLSVATTRRTIANVSVRGTGTTVSMADRTPWLRDLGSHLSDLTRDPMASSPALWRLGRAVRELPYPAPTDERPDPTAAPTAAADDPPSEQRRRRFRLPGRRP